MLHREHDGDHEQVERRAEHSLFPMYTVIATTLVRLAEEDRHLMRASTSNIGVLLCSASQRVVVAVLHKPWKLNC